MFKVNDTILYGTQGVCRITEICDKDMGAGLQPYYVLAPVYQNNAKIFVPVGNEVLAARMRRIISPEEINDLIRAIPDEETVWINDDITRRQKYQEMISSGDRLKLVSLIKTLYLEQEKRKEQGKKLHQADEQIFRRAETLLYNELALVLDIKPEQVVPFLNEQIAVEELKPKKG